MDSRGPGPHLIRTFYLLTPSPTQYQQRGHQPFITQRAESGPQSFSCQWGKPTNIKSNEWEENCFLRPGRSKVFTLTRRVWRGGGVLGTCLFVCDWKQLIIMVIVTERLSICWQGRGGGQDTQHLNGKHVHSCGTSPALDCPDLVVVADYDYVNWMSDFCHSNVIDISMRKSR